MLNTDYKVVGIQGEGTSWTGNKFKLALGGKGANEALAAQALVNLLAHTMAAQGAKAAREVNSLAVAEKMEEVLGSLPVVSFCGCVAEDGDGLRGLDILRGAGIEICTAQPATSQADGGGESSDLHSGVALILSEEKRHTNVVIPGSNARFGGPSLDLFKKRLQRFESLRNRKDAPAQRSRWQETDPSEEPYRVPFNRRGQPPRQANFPE